jgi:hypothetical protein
MAGPARPYTEFDLLQALDGQPQYLGVLVSTGAAVNNATTATPFNQTPQGAQNPSSPGTTQLPGNNAGTLAGKVLLLQTTAAGFVLAGASPAITITNQTLPTGMGLIPGTALASGERVIITMLSSYGYLQWLPATSGNLFVWELT